MTLNIGTFYRQMKGLGLELVFEGEVGDEQEDFEKHIQEAFYEFAIYKTFSHKILNHYEYEDDEWRHERDVEKYNNVWQFLHDVAMDYSKKHWED